MATDKYPNQNVNVPITQQRVDAARARLNPGQGSAPRPRPPSSGKGSRRQVGPGEWIDDRVIDVGGMTATKSDGEPPKLPEGRALPATFDPTKVYEVVLSKSVMIDGRWRSPSNKYEMIGAVAEANRACIGDAVELGAIPVEPDVEPS